MVNLLELMEKRNKAAADANALVEKAKTENRKFTDEETAAHGKLKAEVDDLDAQIKKAKEEDERRLPDPIQQVTVGETRTEPFSLFRAINEDLNGKQYSDSTKKVIMAGRDMSMRAAVEIGTGLQIPLELRADVVAASNAAVATEMGGLITPLRNALVTVKAGANFMTGLKGNISLTTLTAATADWAAETGDAADGAGATGELTMSPKRLTTYMAVSKQFLIQDSVGAEAMMRQDLIAAISAKLEGTIFGKANTAATQPDGFFTGVTDDKLKIKGASSWANIIALEKEVDTNNALMGNLAYITNATGKSFLKKTAKATNQAIFLMNDDGTMNGYPVLVTNHMATGLATAADEHGIIFGNWADLIIGQWGALDVTVDPYTLAGAGKVKIVINAYFDVIKRRTASFAAGSLKS